MFMVTVGHLEAVIHGVHQFAAVYRGLSQITQEWNRGNWTSGCVRRTPLKRGGVNSTGGEAGKMDGLLKLNMMKVPDFFFFNPFFLF